MAKLFLALMVLVVSASPPARTQEHDHHGDHHSPYADQRPSGIAALSAQEVEDLRSGAGMGLARAAELNRYPGPKHALELTTQLDLSADQRAEVERIRRRMLEEAQRVGREILAKEQLLDRRFVHRHIDETTLRGLTAEIGTLGGELRSIHLVAHLETAAVLTPEQIEAYDTLRGYRSTPRSSAPSPLGVPAGRSHDHDRKPS